MGLFRERKPKLTKSEEQPLVLLSPALVKIKTLLRSRAEAVANTGAFSESFPQDTSNPF